MLLVKAYILDPMIVFFRTLAINIYLTTFLYINFILKNLGFGIDNRFKKRKPIVIIKESIVVAIAISVPIMIYLIYA